MEILQRELNCEQRDVAKELNGNVLVIAGPGSGKTRLLVHRIAYQLRVTPNEPFKVLALTFTNEAARQLATRLRPIVPSSTRWRIWCGTFHQFGQYLLSNYGHFLGLSRSFEVIDEFQATEILEQVLEKLSITGVKPLELSYSISRFRGRVNRPSMEELASAAGRFDEILSLYAEMKRGNNVVDFDDLIELPIQLLQQQDHVRKLVSDVYKYVFVDELQDTSLLQLELLKEIFEPESSSIFGVADEDQILYEWRDARLQTISEYEEYFRASPKFLVLNYRSPQEIVDVGNALIRHNPGRYDKELRSAVTSRSGKVCGFLAADPAEEAEIIAGRIQSQMQSGLREKGDYLVLGRVGWVLNPIKKSLDQRGIPFVHIGDREVSSSPITRLLKAALAVAGDQPNAASRLERPLREVNSALDNSVLTLPHVLGAIESARTLPAFRFVESLLVETGLKDSLATSTLRDHLDVASKVIQVASSATGVDYRGLSRAIVLEWNRLESQVLRSEDSVKLMSIHQAKGLEFPVVHIIRLEERVIPYVRRDSPVNISEERRLLFVAIMRAEEEVVFSLCRHNDRGWPCNPSPFFNDITGYEIHQLE